MAVKLYMQKSFPAAENFAREGLIELLNHPPDLSYLATIGKGNCACNYPYEWVVDNKCIYFQDETNYLNAFPGYKLEGDFTQEELILILTWLTRSKFYSFQHNIENGTLNRFLSQKSFQQVPSICGHCFKYRLNGIPVFFCKKIVIAGENKGPTLESVLLPCHKNLN